MSSKILYDKIDRLSDSSVVDRESKMRLFIISRSLLKQRSDMEKKCLAFSHAAIRVEQERAIRFRSQALLNRFRCRF
jgi:hypothetical protein